MAVEPSTAQPRRTSLPAWAYAKELWTGLSIIAMWLAVLFVGLFGGDFVSSSGSGVTKIPVVVFLLPFVLPATIAVARRGFTTATGEGHGMSVENREAHEQTAREPSSLRARPV